MFSDLSKNMRRRLYVLIGWTALSAFFLAGYLLFVEWVWQGWYYFIWPVLSGGIIWRYHFPMRSTLLALPWPVVLKYVGLVYVMVMAEEVLAASLNHLSEGFYFPLYIQRIGQFWALNLLAFSGMAWGTYFVFSRVYFSRIEMFCVLGMFGQVSEHLVYRLLFVPDERIAAFVLMPLNFWVYGLIFLPAFFVLEDNPRKRMRVLWRYPIVFFAIVICSVPFIVFLDWSRGIVSEIYPPRAFIP